MRLKKSKRLVSLLLAGSMIVSMVPVSAVTAFAETIPGNSATAEAEQVVAVTVDNFTTGQLQEAIEAKYANVAEITVLTVKAGKLSADDFYYIRDNLTAIEKLDLSGTTCVDDKIPGHAFVRGISKEDADKELGAQGTAITTLKTFVYPQNVKEIGVEAFARCSGLTGTWSVPDSVTTLDVGAFASVGYTGELNIPGRFKVLPKRVFAGSKCSSLVLNEGVEEIGEKAFINSFDFRGNVTIPTTVKKIGQSAFQSAPFDGTLTFTAPVDLTAGSAFNGCKFTKVNLVDGIKAIGPGTFTSNSFQTIKLNDDLETISNGAFQFVPLTEIVIPDSVKEIGSTAFFDNSRNPRLLKKVFLGKNIQSIGEDAFQWQDQVQVLVYTGEAALDLASAFNYSNQSRYTLITNGGIFGSTDVVDESNNLIAPTRNGYRFEGWYDNAEFNNEKVTTPEIGKTYYAKWYEYNAVIDAEEKTDDTKSNYVGSPIDIAVEVNAEAADVESIQKADLIFDNIDDIEKVEVNGKELAKPYTNIDFGGLMNQSVATLAMVPVTKEPIIFSVTFKTPGEHTVKIVLKDDANNVICSQDTTVKVVEKPILTFSDDCVVKVNGDEIKSGAEVEIGATVTVNLAKDVDSGMKFGSYVIDPIPEKVEYNDTTATFAMPAKNTSITLHLDPADTEDDSWDAATVATGVAIGAGAAVLTYHIGTELYAEQVLGKGVAVPKTREDVALKAWELAGKPAVELNGEPLSETAQAEKWAVESGLMQNVDGSFNGQKKMSKLKALRVLDRAKKMA